MLLKRRLLSVSAAMSVIVLLAGCGGGAAAVEDRSGDGSQEPAAALDHIHGLGVDPEGDRLLIATHRGLFAADKGEKTPERMSEHAQDIMGFAVVAPKHYVGSGHPSVQQDLPPLLGLIESRDGGSTWDSVSLLGEADFHTLVPAGGKLYGYDGGQGRLLVSSDKGGNSKRRRAPGAFFSIAADPKRPARVAASTEKAS